jgi:hypothetical protein
MEDVCELCDDCDCKSVNEDDSMSDSQIFGINMREDYVSSRRR